MKINYCAQGSDAWWEAKRGVPSASNFDRIITSTGKPSKGMDGYIAELIADIAFMGPNYFTTQGRPVTRAMTAGTDCEPEARRFYEMENDCRVQQVGFVTTDDGSYGCSPDGLIGEVGGLELKCPELKTQAAYLLKGTLPREYKAQVHGALVITGREWWDFMSYAVGLQPLVIRIVPDDYTQQLRDALEVFSKRFAAAKEKLLNFRAA